MQPASVIIADLGNSRIVVMPPSYTSNSTVVALPVTPYSVAIDGAGNLIVDGFWVCVSLSETRMAP